MKDINIGAQRLLNQHIIGRSFKTPEEVVKWMVAMQAQDYHQALWAIGLRMQSPTIAAIEQAIQERKILRTWPIRGTIHFVIAEDAKWMTALSAPRLLAQDRRRLIELEITDEILKRCRKIISEALSGGKGCTRAAMMSLLEDNGISTNGQRGYHILWCMAQESLICFGPIEDKQQTFVLLDVWVPSSRTMSREESLAELAGRYFASHGPATLQDFAGWAGLLASDAQLAVDIIKQELIEENIDGKKYYMTGRTQISSDTSGVHLLPGFDEYLLGYKDRSAVLTAEHAPKIIPGNNGVFQPTVVIEGQVRGTWKRVMKKKSVEVNVQLFAQSDNYERELIEDKKRYSRFVGLPLSEKK